MKIIRHGAPEACSNDFKTLRQFMIHECNLRTRQKKKQKTIKIISKHKTIQSKVCMLFLEENSILKKFKHPNPITKII